MKKYLCLLLCVCLFVLSACGGKHGGEVGTDDGYDTSTDTGDTDSATDSDNKPTETEMFKVEDFDVSVGQSLKIMPQFLQGKKEVEYKVTTGDDCVKIEGNFAKGLKCGSAEVKAYLHGNEDEFDNFTIIVSGKDGYFKINNYLYATEKGGTYDKEFNLQLVASSPLYTIRYTLNGDKPTLNDKVFTDFISIKDRTDSDISEYRLTTSVLGDPTGTQGNGKCFSYAYYDNIESKNNYPKISLGTVVTASVFDENGNELSTSSMTYVVKADAREYFSVPVVCVTMPYDDLFSSGGMYNNIFSNEKYRANLEYYDNSTGESFNVNSQIKVGGGWSRGYPQRTLHLNFNKDEKGNKNSPQQIGIYGDRTKIGDADNFLTGFTRMRLHNGGNSFEADTHFNDALIQQLAEGTNVSTTGYRPCIVYLNGEYWGYYAIREHYSDTYFSDNFGVKKSDVVYYDYSGGFVLEDGDEEKSPVLLNELLQYFENNDFTNASVYNYAINNLIDKDSFMDLMIFEGFARNWDHVANLNNFRMWRTVKTSDSPYYDGRWRACMHDVDFAFLNDRGNYLVPKEYDYYGGTPSTDYSYDKFMLYSKLLDNESFKKELCERLLQLTQTNLSKANMVKKIESMAKTLKPLLPDHVARWGMSYGVQQWENAINQVKTLLVNRIDYFVATTFAICDYYENDSAADSVKIMSIGSNRTYSKKFDVNKTNFDCLFVAHNGEFFNDAGNRNLCRGGIVFYVSDGSEVEISWDTSYFSSTYYKNLNGNATDNDYINVGTHRFKVKFSDGKVYLLVDGYFKSEFTLATNSKMVSSFAFFVSSSKITVNEIYVDC